MSRADDAGSLDERRLLRADFTLSRDYPAPVARVWDAFSVESEKLAWFGQGGAFEPGAWAFDFRVGGVDVAEGRFHGVLSRYEATYRDIVEHVRIVTTYDMWLDGVHMSTSIASFEVEPITSGTRFTHTEQGVFYDRFTADAPGREEGSRGLLDQLGRHLAG